MASWAGAPVISDTISQKQELAWLPQELLRHQEVWACSGALSLLGVFGTSHRWIAPCWGVGYPSSLMDAVSAACERPELPRSPSRGLAQMGEVQEPSSPIHTVMGERKWQVEHWEQKDLLPCPLGARG